MAKTKQSVEKELVQPGITSGSPVDNFAVLKRKIKDVVANKLFLFILAAFFLSCLFFVTISLAATKKCPLKYNSAYKYPGNSTVFYITKNCTKQAFSGPSAFFSYFQSWSQVHKTTKKTLDRVPKDKNFLITIKKPVPLIDSKNTTQPMQAPPVSTTLPANPPTTNTHKTDAVVTDMLKLVQKEQVVIRSLNTNTYKMDVSASYDAYTVPGASFRVVCQQPCPVSENILRLKTVGAHLAINKLLSITKVGPGPNTGPVDIHITGDAECGAYDSNARKDSGFVGWSGSRWNGGYGAGTGAWNCDGACTGSYACLFEYEKNNARELTYPLDEINAPKIESQQLLTHEYAHTLFYDRIYTSPEDFVISLSYFVAGNEGSPVTSACDPILSSATPGTYNLCKKCSFDFAEYGDMFTRADQIYKSNMATDKYKQRPLGGWVTVPQFKQVVENVIFTKTGQNKDAVADCGYDSW